MTEDVKIDVEPTAQVIGNAANTSVDGQISLRQAGAGGALRCASFAIEDVARHLDWHFHELGLPRDEYLGMQEKITALRLAAQDALKPLWALAGAA